MAETTFTDATGAVRAAVDVEGLRRRLHSARPMRPLHLSPEELQGLFDEIDRLSRPPDLGWFWRILDTNDFEEVPSDEPDALQRIMQRLRRAEARPSGEALIDRATAFLETEAAKLVDKAAEYDRLIAIRLLKPNKEADDTFRRRAQRHRAEARVIRGLIVPLRQAIADNAAASSPALRLNGEVELPEGTGG